jgi:hypothetical protein
MKKPIKAKVTPVHDKNAAKPKAKKPVVIPNSIKYAAEKSKSRVVFAVPGRYILKNRRATFAIVRIPFDDKMSPSVATKVFKVTASDMDLTQEQIFALEPIEMDSLSAAPGAKVSGLDSKMGKKTHAPNTLSKGWWVFRKGNDGKVAKAFAGGRISGRRILSLIDPSQAPKPKTEVVDETKKAPVKKTAAELKAVGKIKALQTEFKKLGGELTAGKERLTTLQRATSKIALKEKLKKIIARRKEISAEIKALKSGEPAPKINPSAKAPAAKPTAPAKITKSDISALPKRQQTAYMNLKQKGTAIVQAIKALKEKLAKLKTKPAKAKVEAEIAKQTKLRDKIVKALADFHEKIRTGSAGQVVPAHKQKPSKSPERGQAVPPAEKPKQYSLDRLKKSDPKFQTAKPKATVPAPEVKQAKQEVKKLDQEIDRDVQTIDRLKDMLEKTKDVNRRKKLQASIDGLNKRIDLKARKQSGANSVLQSKSSEQIYFPSYSAAVQHAVDGLASKGLVYEAADFERIVTHGTAKPAAGKTTRFVLPIKSKGGLISKSAKGLTVAVYHADDRTQNPFELTYYVS